MRGVRLGLAVVVFTAAALFASTGHWPWHRLSAAAERPVLPAPARPAALPVTESVDTLRRGETISELFGRHGIQDLNVSALGPAVSLDPRRLRSGLVFSFRRSASDSAPTHVAVRTSPEQRVIFRRVGGSWNGAVEPIQWKTEEIRIEGAIDNSLYEALDAQVGDDQLDGADRQRLAWDLADVYAWQVDFTRDIRPGDRFQVVFERLVSENGEIRFGRVLASDLTMSGKSLTAFRYEAGGTRRSTTPTGTRSAAPSCAPRSSSAGSRRRSPAPAFTRCSAGPGAMRVPTTPPRRAHRSWPRVTGWCSGPAARAATET